MTPLTKLFFAGLGTGVALSAAYALGASLYTYNHILDDEPEPLGLDLFDSDVAPGEPEPFEGDPNYAHVTWTDELKTHARFCFPGSVNGKEGNVHFLLWRDWSGRETVSVCNSTFGRPEGPTIISCGVTILLDMLRSRAEPGAETNLHTGSGLKVKTSDLIAGIEAALHKLSSSRAWINEGVI